MSELSDISRLKKKRRKNVQEQNAITKDEIYSFAQEFRENNRFPKALLECFKDYGINIDTAILTWHDRMPFGGPTWAYRGNWLTEDYQFYSYEIYLDPKDKFVTEIEEFKNITSDVEVNERKAGIGKTGGWLSIEVLNEINS